MPSAPREQHPKADAGKKNSCQLLAIVNRNKAGLLITDFDYADGNCPHSATTASSFAASTGIADATGPGAATESIRNFCNRYYRLPLRRDWFTINRFHAGLVKNTVPK